MNWEDIMKKKKGTPFPKRIYRKVNHTYYYFVKQKSGKGTYKIDKGMLSYPNRDKTQDVIKVWKEDAIRMAR
tara:strand:- start:656 stop:871 length:216 start_codon:yes stop_codon:yes gene_type:complete